jgi:hypothetical protein
MARPDIAKMRDRDELARFIKRIEYMKTQGLLPKEIAYALGVPRTTIVSRIKKWRRLLKSNGSPLGLPK